MVKYVNKQGRNGAVMRRKLFIYCICMISGIVSAYISAEKGWIFLICAFAFIQALILLFDMPFYISLFFIGGAMLLFNSYNAEAKALPEKFMNDKVDVYAKVIDIKNGKNDYLNLICRTTEIKRNNEITDLNAVITISIEGTQRDELRNREEEIIGKIIFIKGSFKIRDRYANPGRLSRRLFLYSEGIDSEMEVYGISAVGETGDVVCAMKRIIYMYRDSFTEKIAATEQGRAFAAGVLFGLDQNIDQEVYDSFRQAGTAHILAVSGLHIGFAYAVYSYAIKKRRFYGIEYIFSIFLIVYGTAAMWSPSVTRAVMIVFIKLISEKTNRSFDMLSSLSLITLIMAAQNPFCVFSTGMIMSFAAITGMSFFTPHFRSLFSDFSSAAISVYTVLLPYMAYSFNMVSAVSLIANIPIIFLSSIFVPLGILGFISYAISSKAAFAFSLITEPLGRMIVYVNDMFSGENSAFQIMSPKPYVIIIVYVIAFFVSSEYFAVFIIARRDRSKMIGAAAMVIGVTIFSYLGFRSDFDDASIVFVDVGQGDCIHIKSEGGNDILIDGGGSPYIDIAKKVLKPYLLKNQVGDIDLALATHLHADHFLGIKQLSEQYEVKQIRTDCVTGERIWLADDIYIDTIWPDKGGKQSEDENFSSSLFKINYRGTTVLITGDISEEGERELLRKYKGSDILRCDVLKIAHHGSKYSSCEDFIDEVSPKVAVISVGENNKYGHPSNDVIEKLIKKDIMVYRTDTDGAVGIIKDGDDIRICTMKRNTHTGSSQKI